MNTKKLNGNQQYLRISYSILVSEEAIKKLIEHHGCETREDVRRWLEVNGSLALESL